ncbi:MAG: hypothetical protein ACI8UO_001351 [Verrucomicrobiales bacterium]|jgi:hypothetical protein
MGGEPGTELEIRNPKSSASAKKNRLAAQGHEPVLIDLS